MTAKMRLGDLLVASKLITQEQLMKALEIQKTSGGKKLGNILVELGIITENQLLTVLHKKLKVPFVSLNEVLGVEKLIEAIPEDIARLYEVFPSSISGNTIFIATSDPLDYGMLNHISVITGKNVESAIAAKSDILNAINKYYRKHSIDTMANVLNTSTVNFKDQISQVEDVLLDSMESRVGSVPVVKFINNLVAQAYSKRASDVHIEISEDHLRIRFRIDGELVEIIRMNAKTHGNIVTRIKIMAGMDIAEKRIPLDGRFNCEIDGGELSVRVASMPTVYGEKIVMRLMPDSKSGIMTIEELGITGENADKIHKAAQSPNGLILVTGPTGSGKSTTLYALLNKISTENANVLSIEDPVEKIVPGVNQTQINTKAGLTFATGLRAILRQDPDKVMVGEIRDSETADIAARAAMTGHLVLASLHTNSAAGTYMRLLDMGVEPFIIASSVIASLAQRLVKLICPHCKEEYLPTETEQLFFKSINRELPQRLYRGRGCDQCEHTGFLGRTVVHEVIITDSKIRELIMEKAKTTDIEDYLNEKKNQKYMLDVAIDLVESGQVHFTDLIKLTPTFGE